MGGQFLIAGLILILIFTILLSIVIKNFKNGIKSKESFKCLIRKNSIYIGILILEVIGVILARIKFYIDYGL